MHIRATCTGPGCIGSVVFRLTESGRFVGVCDACAGRWDLWEGTVTRLPQAAEDDVFVTSTGGWAGR